MIRKPEADEDFKSGALPASLRGRLVRARERYGLASVLAATRTAEATHWRAEAGGNLYRGTILSIEQGLLRLEHSNQERP
jgi:hypothetical protein